jgi:protein pelota
MEEGISNLFLVAKNVTYLKSKIEHNLPKKKTRAVVHDKYSKAQEAFFTKILAAMLKHINIDVVKSIIIASPGYTKNEFWEYLSREFESNKYPEFKNRKEMFILEHSTSGFKHSLKELLINKDIQGKISQSSAISEAKVLEEFYDMLRKNPDRAAYGKAWVMKAIADKAVHTLLITDKVLRPKNGA